MTTTTKITNTYKQGDVVRYEDMYNFDTHVVVRVENCAWSTYTLCNTRTCEITVSDMRQRGWSLVA